MRELRAVYDWDESSVRLTVSPSLTARLSYYFVQEIGRFRAGSTYLTERANLDSYLLVLTLAGSGCLQYQGQTHQISENELFWIDCRNYQCYYTVGTEPWEFLWVHFDGAASKHYYDLFVTETDGAVLRLKRIEDMRILLETLTELQLKKKDRRTEILSSKLLVDLLTDVVLKRLDEASGETRNYVPAYIDSVRSWLEMNYAEEVTLDRVAHQYAVSKYHLARQFKRFTGFTVHHYLLDIRMKAAMELLKYEDLPIHEVAEHVGFESTSYFIHTFQKHVGTTPLQYRRAWTNSEMSPRTDSRQR